VHNTLTELCSAVEPERELVIGRELTKLHEQAVLLQAGGWLQHASLIPELGEFTIAVAAAPVVEQEVDNAALQTALARLQAADFSRKDALRALAAVWDMPANKLKALGYGRNETS
jgi:16S rRNA (cytidine1402-2'-O)-methyltransferase